MIELSNFLVKADQNKRQEDKFVIENNCPDARNGQWKKEYGKKLAGETPTKDENGRNEPFQSR